MTLIQEDKHNNLPMAINKKTQDCSGYVYFIRFNFLKNCYKIGSTSNVYKRLKAFGDRWFDVDLLAYGYASDKLLVERQIQYILRDYNNNQKCYRTWPPKFNYQYAGDLNSTEYFIFDTITACNVIMLFDMLCDSVKIGSDDPVYGINPNCKPIGYGEELQKYYDTSMDLHVPYPTKFTDNGVPIYHYREDWDSIPYFKQYVEYTPPPPKII